MRSAVAPGVFSGIGQATAFEVLSHGWRVFGSVRRLDDAK